MKRKILFFFGLLLLFLISLSFSYFLSIYGQIKVNGAKGSQLPNIEVSPTPTPDPLAPRNILVLGYGGNGHDGGLLTDTMILFHISPKEKKISLISIPRDLLVPLQVSKTQDEFKINHAYAIGSDDRNYPDKPDEYKGEGGGGNLAKMAASYALGIPIDHFVSVNFDGFIKIIDILGGVNVDVPYTFNDEYYPIKGLENETCGKSEDEIISLSATMSANLLEREFKCRYETLHFDKGKLTMDGETALKFVRSRHSEIGGGDFGRSIRQQALVVAIKNKFLKFGSLIKMVPILNSVAKNVRTDVDITSAVDLVSKHDLFGDFVFESNLLSTDNILEETTMTDGQYVLIPKGGKDNWQPVHDYVKSILDD